MSIEWHRVNKAYPCPVCGKDSWCCYTDKIILCMRVQSKVEKMLRSGELGWVHPLDGAKPIPYSTPSPPPPVINVGKILKDWSQFDRKSSMINFATSIGVTLSSLALLECVKAPYHKVWAFPMSDGYGNHVGIRLRREDGQKWAERGSHSGIFLPKHFLHKGCNRDVLITEGPTDTAAALSMGLFAIGRPSCSGGAPHLIAAIRRLGITRAVVVADNDDPGLKGAQMLCDHLPCSSCILVLPAKDIRDFLRLGGTPDMVKSMVAGLVWRWREAKQTAGSIDVPA